MTVIPFTGYLVECQVSQELTGILHPGTSFGVFWSTSVAQNWYRSVKYPLIPEKPGIQRGIPCLQCKPPAESHRATESPLAI